MQKYPEQGKNKEVDFVKNGRKLFLAAGLLLVPLLATNVSFAAPGKSKKGGNGNGNVKTEFEAELEPFVAPPPAPDTSTIEGEAEYEQKINKNVDRQRFKAKVEIPVTNPSPFNITDLASAQAARLEIRLTHAGSMIPYATCFLVLKEFEQEFEDGILETEAEYVVDVRFHNQPGGSPRYREHAGSCDIANADPMIPPTQGVPAVMDGDSAAVFLISETIPPPPAPPTPVITETQLLTGLFD